MNTIMSSEIHVYFMFIVTCLAYKLDIFRKKPRPTCSCYVKFNDKFVFCNKE